MTQSTSSVLIGECDGINCRCPNCDLDQETLQMAKDLIDQFKGKMPKIQPNPQLSLQLSPEAA